MSEISTPIYRSCYYADTSTGKVIPGKFNYSEFRALLAKRAAAANSSAIKTGHATLTPEDISYLAHHYNPTHMSQTEYTSFIDYLVKKEVLGEDEIYDIGLDRMIIRPGAYSTGCIAPNLSQRDLSLRTLADADGNALYWTKIMAQWRDGSSRWVNVKADAFQKVADILDKMQAQRRQIEFHVSARSEPSDR